MRKRGNNYLESFRTPSFTSTFLHTNPYLEPEQSQLKMSAARLEASVDIFNWLCYFLQKVGVDLNDPSVKFLPARQLASLYRDSR